jgi:hypothetical protein
MLGWLRLALHLRLLPGKVSTLILGSASTANFPQQLLLLRPPVQPRPLQQQHIHT